MFQLLAAIFFALALITPFAVIILTLHSHWDKVVCALFGTQLLGATYTSTRNRIRHRPQMSSVDTVMTIRRVPPARMPLRVAA